MVENAAQQSNDSTSSDKAEAPITPALVREIAEKVYELWVRDLRIERERLRASGVSNRLLSGRRYG